MSPCRFWNEESFKGNFGDLFEFEEFEQLQEPESASLDKQTFITIARAKKLPF
jgi:hypothetical protein